VALGLEETCSEKPSLEIAAMDLIGL